ncbi:hypothetical protein ACLOJK_038670 [Asimina triloba]
MLVNPHVPTIPSSSATSDARPVRLRFVLPGSAWSVRPLPASEQDRLPQIQLPEVRPPAPDPICFARPDRPPAGSRSVHPQPLSQPLAALRSARCIVQHQHPAASFRQQPSSLVPSICDCWIPTSACIRPTQTPASASDRSAPGSANQRSRSIPENLSARQPTTDRQRPDLSDPSRLRRPHCSSSSAPPDPL